MEMILKEQDYLKKLNSKGYLSYIVGGYTRDYLLGLKSFDVDIATSATPEEVMGLFNIESKANFGSIKIEEGPYRFDITTFRKETSYEKRKPKIEFIESIEEDLRRRDFTINAICLDENFQIYDPLNGVDDLKSKTIRVIGEIDKKFEEDPLRILRAIRFAIVYDFKIEKNAFEFIKKNKHLLIRLSYSRKKEELDKMFNSSARYKAISLLGDLNLFDVLELHPQKKYCIPEDYIGFWIYVNPTGNYPFTKFEKKKIQNVLKILEEGYINEETIFNYGLEDTLIGGELLNVDKNEILKMSENLFIRDKRELAIDGNIIRNILGSSDKALIKNVKKEIIAKILSGTLPNKREILVKYILENWK